MSQTATITCSLNEKEYTLSVDDENGFNCIDCEESFVQELSKIPKWSTLEQGLQTIEDYFIEQGGSCQ